MLGYMDYGKNYNKKNIALYMGVMLAVVGIFVAVVYVSLKNISEDFDSDAVAIGDFKNQQRATALEEFLLKGSFFLESAAQTLDHLLALEVSDEEIHKLLVSETQMASKNTGALSGDAFGFIKGRFVHSTDWRPNEGFMPTRRPWYRDALRAHGRVVISKPFVGALTSTSIIAFSKSLQDKESVFAFSIPQVNVRKFLETRFNDSSDVWMVVDKDGLVVASNGTIHQGLNALSNDLVNMEEAKLVREILMSGERPFEFDYKGVKRMVFSTAILDDEWFVVTLTDSAFIYDKSRGVVIRACIAISVVLILLVVFYTASFMNRIRLIRQKLRNAEFLDAVGAEMRIPLNGILGMARILRRDVYDEGLKDYVRNVESASMGLLSVVNDVQEMARVESGLLKINSAEYDLYSVLKDCFDAVSPKATAKNLRFSLECNPDIPSSLWGDEAKIRQIVENLLFDAIRHTEMGEVRLNVGFDIFHSGAERTYDETVNLKFTIKDSGIGIREEEPDTLLGMFLRRGGKKASGVGFSLGLTKRLIEACGGEMVIKSRYGEGASYMVVIPQMVLNVEPLGDFSSRYKNDVSKERGSRESLFAPGARILAVDDAELNLRVIRGLLKDSRVQIDTALNGPQCLEMVRSKHYDLILLDGLMPVMDGRETYDNMKRLADSKNKETPVVVLISGLEQTGGESYLDEGFTDYIRKPLMEEDLLRALKWYLPKRLILTREDLTPSHEIEAQKPTRKSKPVMIKPADSKEGFYKLTDEEGERPSDEKAGISAFGEFLNVRIGLEYCKDEEFYREMLKAFVEEDNREKFEEAFIASDWRNYQILAHSLKSSSLMIGAEPLSEAARALETACKELRYTDVKGHHRRMMDMYSNVVQRIKEAMVRR